jgi:hypothetical protein
LIIISTRSKSKYILNFCSQQGHKNSIKIRWGRDFKVSMHLILKFLITAPIMGPSVGDILVGPISRYKFHKKKPCQGKPQLSMT